MATLTNQNGTTSVDSLTYNKAGTYHALAGSDTIKITGGSGIVVYADSGNNIINVTGGSGHTVKIAVNDADSDKQNGADKLTINGANQVEGYLGSGKDEISLLYTDGKKTNGALSQFHGGAWTDTFTVGNGAKGYQLYGDAGDDIFNINNGSNIVCWGGAANDTFNVTGGTGIKLRGGDSADIYNVSVDGVDMQLGYGNDVVNVTAGNKQQIKGNLGINTINLKAGSGHVITADIDQAASKKQGYTDAQIKAGQGIGYGVDKVNISGSATMVKAHLGDGKDEITVSSGSDHELYTEGWGDTITISGTTTQSFFDAGAGDDIININGGTSNTIVAGEGNDKITVTKGTVTGIKLGQGKDEITVSGGTVASLQTNSGYNTVRVQDEGTVEQLYLGSNGEKETIIVEGGRIEGMLNSFSAQVDFTITGGYSSSVGCGIQNDRVKVKGGSLKRINLGAGDDYIEVTGGAIENDRIDGEDGNDTFDINVSGLKLYGGAGDDVFNINSPLTDEARGRVVSGAGNDRVNITGAHYTIETQTGDDIVTLGSGSTDIAVILGEGKDICSNMDENAVLSKLELRGEDGNDELKLGCRLDHARISGEAGQDILYIGNNKKIGDYNVLDGGDDKDEITCYNNHHGVVAGGQGNDTIVVNQFAYGVIYGDNCYSATSDTCGRDSITLTDINESFINGSDNGRYTTTEDNNTIRIYGKNTRNIIFGGCGENLIRVEGTLTNSILMCGHENDEISIMGTDSKYNAIFGGDGNDDYSVMGGSHNTFKAIAGTNRFTISGGSWNAYVGGRDSDYYYVNSGVQSYNLLRGGSAEDAYYVDSTAKVMIDVETDNGYAMNKVSIFGAKASDLTIKVDKKSSIIQINDILIKGGNCDFYFGAGDMFGTGTKYAYTDVRDLKVGKASTATDLLTTWNTYYAEMGTGGKAISGAELSNTLAPVLSNVESDITRICQTYAK